MATEAPLTTVLRSAARSCDKALAAQLNRLGLTGPRLELLAVYADNPGITNAEAGRRLDLSMQSAHAVTDALASNGWISIGAARGRSMPVTVTDAGHEILAAAQDAVRPVEKRLGVLLGASGARHLRQSADALAKDAAPASSSKPAQTEKPHAKLTNAALGLHHRALAWADDNHSDVVPAQVVRRWTSAKSGLADRLVDAGMWKPDGDDGWRVR